MMVLTCKLPLYIFHHITTVVTAAVKSSLNISAGHRTMSGVNLSYDRQLRSFVGQR